MGEEEGFFEGVEAVALGFKMGGQFWGRDFAVLFEASERLFGALEAGEADVEGVEAVGFGWGGEGGADVVLGVAGGGSMGEVGAGGGQIVAELLAELGEVGIVERETGVVFDDAESFGGAVGGGVEDSGGGGVGHFLLAVGFLWVPAC